MGGWAGEDKGGETGAANTPRGYSQSCRRGLGGPGNRNVVCFSGLHISPTETSEKVRGRRPGRCGRVPGPRHGPAPPISGSRSSASQVKQENMTPTLRRSQNSEGGNWAPPKIYTTGSLGQL